MKSRILGEIANLKKEKVEITLVEENINHLIGTIDGPVDTPYEGGKFKLDIILLDQYPFEPPKVKFITPVWHPNISSVTGAICLDILKDKWSPALSIQKLMISLQSLLSEPVPEDPQDAVVATQLLTDKEAFNEKARLWTTNFAK